MKHWYRPGALKWLLWPASLLYGAVASVRRLLYAARLLPRHRAGIPVIVVGNLVDAKPEDIRIGLAVEVFFEKITDAVTLPQFRPARGRGGDK